jgi:hypothetical protein
VEVRTSFDIGPAPDHAEINEVYAPAPSGVDTNTPGKYRITYTATDSGNRTGTATRIVIVVPGGGTAPPQLTLIGDPQMIAECGSFTDPGATATVPCGGSVPVTTTGTVDAHTPGVYTLTYTACVIDTTTSQCDPARTASAERTVTVQDTTAPTITVDGPNPLQVECHGTFNDPGATAHDACAADFAATASGTVDPNTVGSYTITYNATDPSGNAAAPVTRTVNVVDTTPPAITTCPAPRSADANSSCQAAVPDFTGAAVADDLCGSAVTFTQSPAAGTMVGTGPTTVTITATDIHNNSSVCHTTFTVNDTTPPTIALNGVDPISVECHTSFTDPGATAHDNCSSDFAATASGSVNVNVVGSYTLTYNATDAAGNHAAAVTRTVNVVDTTAPTTVFDNLTIFFNNLTIVFNTNSFTVNGTTYPFNGVSCTHDGYTFTFNGQTVTITKNGYSASYTFNGKTLVLWTPTHQYQTVKVADLLASAGDTCDTTLGLSQVVIQSVSSDEPQDIAGGGDGNTLNDMVIAADCKSVQLRAERNGNGNGRVYTITFRVRDASGNTTTTTSKLKIFANSSNVVDDGAAAGYTVNGTCP